MTELMEASNIVEKTRRLNDVELAILLCLTADQHCIIRSRVDAQADLDKNITRVGIMLVLHKSG